MENNKNSVIIVLAIALVFSLYFVFQGKPTVTTGDNAMNSSNVSSIPPSQALKDAFEESSKHSAMADIAELSCFPSKRYDCSLEDGCMASAPGTYYFVDYGTESGTYFRCDTKGCDPYPVKVVTSGIYTQFIPELGQAMMFKVVTDDALGNKGEFVDVATLGTATLTSFGKCEMTK